MKKNSLEKPKIQDNIKNPRVRALMFFCFYLIFFIILFAMIGNNSNETLEPVEKHETVNISYKFENINQKNYHFNYEIQENVNTIIYDGEKNLTKEKFTVTKDLEEKEYFNSDGIFLTKNNESWQLSDSPYLYSVFLDHKEINRMIKNSTFISKTEYSNQEVVYQYEISTTTLLDLIDDVDVDLMDEVNKINLYVKDNEVYKMKLDVTPYFKYKDENINNLLITLEYTMFGEIKDLQTPKY